jgi:putative nucleotidyltransferase with HDIG domain
MTLKKIPVTQVATGMFINRFEGSWINHSFWRTKFLVSDDALLTRVRTSGAMECWIDVNQGIDGPADTVQPLTPDSPMLPAPRASVATSMTDELQRVTGILSSAKAMVTRMFNEARMGKAIDASQCATLVNDIVESVDRNSDALISLSRLKLANDYTCMHSVAVCALMVSLGRQLQFDDEHCRQAGMAGLLHDMGKAAVPVEILNKPGKLTDEEFDIIKQHPVRGQKILIEGGFHEDHILDVCRHHHERMDGGGYPDRLQATQISLLARMGAVCDVYDAVTSDRSYKAGWDPAESIARMASWQGHFDEEILHAFVKSIGIYPTGSLVRLTSGRLAVVVEQSRGKLTAPKVKIFFSTNSGVPLRPELVDLSDPSCSVEIESRESPQNWQFGYLNALWAGESEVARLLDEQAGQRTPRTEGKQH